MDKIRKFFDVIISPHRLRKALIRRLPRTIHVGNRNVCDLIKLKGENYLRKKFPANSVYFSNELLAYQTFEDHPWMPKLIDFGDDYIVRPFYPEGCRLDNRALELSENERLEIARQAGLAILEMLEKGYSHRDFHAKNLYWVNGKLKVTDFEVMEKYPVNMVPPFVECYDITGKGLESPVGTKNMSFFTDTPSKMALTFVLGLDKSSLLSVMENTLKDLLRESSLTFKGIKGRKTCRAERIYSSFSLPYFEVISSEAQRDVEKRLINFGIDEKTFLNKKVLDLGSNIGGISLQCRKFSPDSVLGIEFDSEKVRVANLVAAYNGFNNIKFIQGDLDKLSTSQLAGPFDIVFCLALEAHVKNKNKLFNFVGELTKEKLFFEGNSTTNKSYVEKMLLGVGFSNVVYLGLSDDDCRPENNRRPLFIAEKQ